MSVLRTFRLKSCPRCKGDIVIERDRWGWYEQCIQCGYLRDLEMPIDVEIKSEQISKNQSSSDCVNSERILV